MKWMLLPAGIFTADYIMKKRAESWNEEEAPEKMLGGHIILQKLHNRGAALSFMEKLQNCSQVLQQLLQQE